MSKLEKIHSSQLYHPLPLLLGQRGELCRAASAVMHIGHEIIRALEHPAVAPFDGVAGMDEFQPLREHRVLKAGSGALQVTERSRSPEAHCLEELKKRIDKREEQTSQAVLHTGQGAVYSSRAFAVCKPLLDAAPIGAESWLRRPGPDPPDHQRQKPPRRSPKLRR